jgi:hypothetical protein
MSVTEATKVRLPMRRKIFGKLIDRALPLIGLGIAVIVNAAWVGLVGYFVFKLV